MIRIDNLSFAYGGGEKKVLEEISLHIGEGDFLGIIGPSGAGKSTLAFAVNGVVPHHFNGDFYGRVTVDGLDSLEAGPEALARRVGSVLQDIESQLLASVVEDEILFGLENFSLPRAQIEERISYALAAAGISDLRARAISSLSGGQKQKVAIAAIMALRPKIMLLDEPTGELDPQSSLRVFETLSQLNRLHGVTIVVIEQKIMMLCEFAHRLAVMERGRLILEGPVEEVLLYPEKLEAAGVNIPRVATLAGKLRARGLYQGKTPLNIAQATAMMKEATKDAALG
ncbi:MAG: ATP-binding cassette domain-containing protein [Desulfarculales bacterium]|jgi:energy-coupling factor transport system ATP-binding protein|nr:ATP-binding cassette domain-containing protein [Desulfarculales bacterium]